MMIHSVQNDDQQQYQRDQTDGTGQKHQRSRFQIGIVIAFWEKVVWCMRQPVLIRFGFIGWIGGN